MDKQVVIDVSTLYDKTAKIAELENYVNKAKELAGGGNNVILTGAGPIWLYLKIAHALHGKAKRLTYRSPVTGDILIFDHSPL
jgi:hypothetical protein